MFESILNNQTKTRLQHTTDAADASMVGRIRLVLSISALLTVFIDPEGVDGVNAFTWLIFSGYTFHTLILYILSQLEQPFLQSKLIHWLDVCWYALIVYFTGSSNSFFFLFFFFAILTSSFRWGFEEGTRVTIVSSGLFIVTGLAMSPHAELYRLLLRTTFILGLGYMIAYWGGAEVAQKRRLALLRDVSQLSNPRFGVDHTIASVLEKTRAFFKASSCILVVRDKESGSWSLRTAMEDQPGRSVKPEQISPEAAAPLNALPQEQIVVYSRPPSWTLSRTGRCLIHDNTRSGWRTDNSLAGASLAELLDARSFISAPLPSRRGEGRLYVTSHEDDFHKADALFLSHLGAQTFPVIENIELLDRLVSQATLRERKKISLDLHDTAIQPYIGLKHGLHAMRKKAGADNPLMEDLNKLMTITNQVVGDLRRFAGTFKNGSRHGEPDFFVALHRQVAQFMEFYGIDISTSIEHDFDMNDRLAAEVFQIVNEGLSNIRKHTSAQRGFIQLRCVKGWLNIRIENECRDAQPDTFTPRSITERASALGGKAHVRQTPDGSTAILIEIPL